MKISIKIARRYLFARRSANAINVITGISVAGIAIGTAALVLVLSVFNGFEDLIVGLFSKFNPDIKVEAAAGKTFDSDAAKAAAIRALPEVAFLSETLEEVAFFEYGDNQDFGILKGVDSFYHRVTGIDTTLYEGSYRLQESDRSLAVLGGGMRNKLQADVENPFELLNIFMARREKVGVLEQQYKKRFAFPAGSFRIQQDYDNQYVLVSLDFARDMLGTSGEISAYEIRLQEGSDKEAVIERIQAVMGEGYEVKDRYRQDESFLKLMNIEKWMSFAILSLTLVLVAFNMIGSLWMMVLDKKGDIAILKSMGAQDVTIRNIFLYLGLLLCLLGLAIGFLLATVLYVVQKTYGIVAIPEGFVVSAYPISLRFPDLVAVMLVVLFIGLIASLPAAIRARQVSALINRE
ncbi:MAG: hypothetical protein RI973_1608 [Bacteroidota bacterium]